MDKIRVKNKDTYVIEVNDQGDTIEFDLTSIELPLALERTQKMAKEATNWLKRQQFVIAKKPDTVRKGDLMSERERATLEAYRETFKRLRKAVDEFAGAGASDKIFGEQNYLEMFNDFMEAMEPCLKKMEERGMSIRKRIEAKYGNQNSDEL